MGFRLFAASALVAAFAMSAPAGAQTVLRMSSWLPPSHPIVEGMMVPWAEQVETATEGRVTVEILDAPLGKPPAHFDLAADGIVDITYGVHGYTPGRFKLTQLAELPFLADDATSMSVAYWRIYESTLAAKGEHEGVKVLGVFTHGPGMLWTTGTDVSPVSGLAGAKIRVAGAVSQKMVTALEMTAIQAPAPQSFELLSGGVADGIVFPGESITFFKLDGLVKQGLRVEGGLYNVSFFFVMNEDSFAALSPEDQAAIDAISGEAFAKLAGGAWDAADEAGLAALDGKVTIAEVSDSDMTALETAAAPIYDGVRADFEAAGLDFDAALAALKSEIAAAE